MTLPRFWAFLAVALPVVAALIASLSAVDLTYQLRAGAEILVTASIPTTDTWTFTVAGQPWFDQQWGAQGILSAVFQIGGWTGLALLRAALLGIIVLCLFVIARRAGLADRGAALLTIGAFLIAAPAMALRPQIFGMALFALVLLILSDRRAHPDRCWLIPVIVLAWANLHGSFFLGPLVVGLAWIADVHDRVPQPHRLLAVASVSALAACVTPFGPAVWTYAASLSVDPFVTQRISEWQRTSLGDPAGVIFAVSVVAVIGLLYLRRAAVVLPILLWLGVFALVGLYAIRGVAWWGIAMVPVVATLAAAGSPSGRSVRLGTRTMRRLNLVLAVVLIATGVAFLPVWRVVDPATGAPVGLLTDAPPGVTAAVRSFSQPGDHVFAPQPWGSWFEFATPDLRVAVDSRIELFPATVWTMYDAVRAGAAGWEAIMAEWGVTLVALEPGDAVMVTRLTGAGWTVVSSDGSGTVMRRPG